MDSRNVAAFSKPRRSSRASQDSNRAFSNRRKGNNEPGSSSRNTGINGRKNRSSRASCKSKSGSRRSSRRQNKKSKKKLNSSRTKAANDSVPRLKASPLVARKAVTENVNHGEEHHCHDFQSFDCHQQGRLPRAPVHSTPPFQSDGFVNYVTLTLPYHIAKAAKQIEREEQIEFEQYRRQYIENRGARLGPPIPLNFDDSDDEIDTSGQYSDISDWDSACLHEQKLSDQFTFPLSKCAPKGISARWQEQHPQWRDGRYCIDRMISPASTPPVLSSSLQPFSQRQYQDSRGSAPPAFEVYEDDE